MPIRLAVTSAAYASDASFSVVTRLVRRCLADEFELDACPDVADLQIHVGTPDSLPPRRRNLPLATLTFSEATRIPKPWVARLQTCDAVWAASRFTADALQASGVTTPIAVVPLGVDCPEQPTGLTPDPHRPFTFFWMGTRALQYIDGRRLDGDRKRGLHVRNAFQAADLDNCRLILKSLPVENREYDITNGSTREICRSYSGAELAALWSEADALIWPTMGEGFGLPPLEMLAHGIPVFPTFWSGPAEYLQDFPLPRLKPTRLVDVLFNQEPAQMADVSLDELTTFLRDCDAQRDVLRTLRQQLAAVTRQRWDYRVRMQPRLNEEIHRLLQRDFYNGPDATPAVRPDQSCLVPEAR